MVNSSFGHVHRTRDGLVIGQPRKQNRENRYTRDTTTNRKTGKREKAAVIMLRRKGYTYNQLASAFERSSSYIYRIIRKAMNNGSVKYRDYRVIPYITKMLSCNNRLGMLFVRFNEWMAFINGETDKPP